MIWNNTEVENAEYIVIAIGKEIGVDLRPTDISACHRVKKSKGDPILITKFVNRKKKDEFMAKRRNLKSKTIGTLNLTADETKRNGKIYINESLTKINRDLFRSVRLECAEKGWKYSWTRNGVVYARKDDNSAISRFTNVQELEQKLV